MSRRARRAALLGALFTLTGGVPGALGQDAPVRAESATRFRVMLNAAFDLGSLDFTDSRAFELFKEDAQFDARYEVAAGNGFDGGLQFDITPLIGAMAAFSTTGRDADVSFTASLPHPLFFDQPRGVSGEASDLSYEERAVHVGLTVGGSAGKLDFTGFGGVTFFKVEATLVQDIDFDQIYPFDSVTLVGTSSVSVEDSPVGFHVGARLDYRFARHVGLGAQLRFSRASARLEPAPTASIDVDIGGAQAAVAATETQRGSAAPNTDDLRIYF